MTQRKRGKRARKSNQGLKSPTSSPESKKPKHESENDSAISDNETSNSEEELEVPEDENKVPELLLAITGQLKDLTKNIKKVRNSQEKLTSKFDKLESKVTTLENVTNKHVQEIDQVKSILKDSTQKMDQNSLLVQQLNEQTNVLERKSREKNLRLIGIQESRGENVRGLVQNVLESRFNMLNVETESAHRTGQKPQD